jgi:hypothetical protein
MNKQTQTDHVSPVEFTRANIDMLRNVAIELTEARHRLHSLRVENVRAAFSENSKLFKSLLSNVSETSTLLAQWSTLFQTKMLKFTEIGNDCFEITSKSIAGIAEAMSQAFLTSGETVKKMSRWGVGAVIERRTSATVISFPERRKIELAIHSADKSIHPAAKKRQAA